MFTIYIIFQNNKYKKIISPYYLKNYIDNNFFSINFHK